MALMQHAVPEFTFTGVRTDLSLVTLAAARLSQFVDLQRCTRSALI